VRPAIDAFNIREDDNSNITVHISSGIHYRHNTSKGADITDGQPANLQPATPQIEAVRAAQQRAAEHRYHLP
jgi:hypothetical protein